MRTFMSRALAVVSVVLACAALAYAGPDETRNIAQTVSPLSVALIGIGFVFMLVSSLWFLVVAFRVHIGWGFACLFIPFASLVFLVMHWRAAWKPFVLGLIAAVPLTAGSIIAAADMTVAFSDAMKVTIRENMKRVPVAVSDPLPIENVEAPTEVDVPGAALPVSVGDSLSDVRDRLGAPDGKLEQGDKVMLLYPGFTVIAKDGVTVSTVERKEEYRPIQRVKPKPRPPARRAAATPAVATIANGGREVNLKNVLVRGKITIVDFYADWCGPCRMMAPHLEKLARSDRDVVLRKVDIVKWGTPVAKQYKIASIPNVRVYDRQGKPVGQPTHDLRTVQANVRAAK